MSKPQPPKQNTLSPLDEIRADLVGMVAANPNLKEVMAMCVIASAYKLGFDGKFAPESLAEADAGILTRLSMEEAVRFHRRLKEVLLETAIRLAQAKSPREVVIARYSAVVAVAVHPRTELLHARSWGAGLLLTTCGREFATVCDALKAELTATEPPPPAPRKATTTVSLTGTPKPAPPPAPTVTTTPAPPAPPQPAKKARRRGKGKKAKATATPAESPEPAEPDTTPPPVVMSGAGPIAEA